MRIPAYPAKANKWPGCPGGALLGEGFNARDYPRDKAPVYAGAFLISLRWLGRRGGQRFVEVALHIP